VPKKLSVDLNDALPRLLGAHPEGAGIDAIVTALGDVASKRTLQRRLTGLMQAKLVVSLGEARALRYFLAPSDEVQIDSRRIHPDHNYRSSAESLDFAPLGVAEITLPFSTAAADARAQVHQPIAMRRPVGYRREFLDAYRPNETRYLSPDVVAHLRRLGQVPAVELAAGTYSQNILQRLLIDLSWASSRLEGNTYSLLETERLLQAGEAAPGRNTVETQMILNHKDAIEFLVSGTDDIEIGINDFTVKNLHALLASNLLADPTTCGRLRSGNVGIGGSVYLPLNGGPVLSEMFAQLIDTAAAIREPYEQAFFLLVQLPYLQPFDDVNKRVSRLAANIPLIKQQLCPLSFIDVPQQPYIDGLLAVYELNRVELLRDVFIWAYERSAHRYTAVRHSIGEPDRFRLRYRDALLTVVRDAVLNKIMPSPHAIKVQAIAAQVADEHVDHFVRLVQQELNALHEGNFARFKVRPSEFEAWRKAVRKSSRNRQ
jgi:Fic family protein